MVTYLKWFPIMPQNQGERRSNCICLLTQIMLMTRSNGDQGQGFVYSLIWHVSCGTFVEFWGLPPLILFFNMSIGWFGRFALSTECNRTRKLDYKDLNWPRCSARVTESLALTDGGFCRKQNTLF